MAIDTVNSLTTLADVKTWCGIASGTTEYDTLLEGFIDSVSWQFNKFTDRLLKARDITGYYTGDNSNCLMLPEWPVNSITSIHVDSDREYGSDTEVTDYVFEDEGIITADTDAFSSVAQANKVVYNAGYSTLPYDLVLACKDQIKWLFRRHRDNTEAVSVETSINGAVTVTEQGEILKTSLEILKRYRKRDHR